MAAKIDYELEIKPLEISSKTLGHLADALATARIKFFTRS